LCPYVLDIREKTSIPNSFIAFFQSTQIDKNPS
jgi:hypothetical protein